MSRVITGTFTEPDLDNLSGTIRFVSTQSSLGIPVTTEGDITVTDGAYSGTIANGVYTVKFIYGDPVSSINRIAILGTDVVVEDGADIDVITLCGLSEIPTPVTQAAIDDAISTHEADTSGHPDAVAGTSAGFMSAADKTKLDGVEVGAEVNNISDTDATDLTDSGESTLHYHASDRDRANHTGTQLSSTISDFDSAADARIAAATGVSVAAYVQNNYAGTTAPTVNDDSSAGYSAGSLWFDTTSSPNEAYRCTDATAGAAVWLNTSLELGELGSMASQDADNVTITGGTASGVNVDDATVTGAGYYDATTIAALNTQLNNALEITSGANVEALYTQKGDDGGLYVLSPSYMYTDTAGTTNVSADGDPCGNITDSSGNGYDFASPSDAARPTYKTDGTYHWIQLDKVDDNYSTTFTNPIVGTMLIGTTKGTIHLEVNIPAGAWSLTPNAAFFPGNTVTDIIIKNGYMTDIELANAKAWLASRGSPEVYTPDATDLVDGSREWGTLTSVMQGADLSNVTTFFTTFANNQLTSIPAGLFDFTPNVTTFRATFANNQLTSIPAGLFDNTTNVASFYTTFYNNQITSIPTGLFDNTPNVTTFRSTFYNNQITSIPTGLFDNTPNVETFDSTFANNQLTSIPAGLFDNTTTVTTFVATFTNNTTLTDVPAGLFDNQTVCTNYTNCFTTTALTQASIDNVLVSIAYSYTTNGLTGGQFDQSGGSAPSATGQAAIDTLRAAGMTVNVTGGY